MTKKTVLANGVRLLSERQPHAFSATVGLWMEVGSRDENPLQNGISHYIEHMAFKGTQRRSALDIAREMDRLGGLANAFTSKENTCFHARALAQRLPEMCDLLADISLRPALDPEELERERGVILQEISGQEDEPDELVHVMFGEHFWPGHPLGRPILGTEQTIEAMDREAIQEYLAQTYLGGRAVVSAVGNLEHEALVEILGPVLETLPAGNGQSRRQPPAATPQLQVVERDLEQVHVALGLTAPEAASPQRFSAALLNMILGGNMSSRLFQEVRERRGLAYAVYSYLSTYCDTGLLGIYLGVAPERLLEALKVVRAELERLAALAVTEVELAEAKESLHGSILLSAENPESRMSRLARNEYNFGRDVPLEEALAQVEAVQGADIAALASQMLARGQLGATVLGPVKASQVLKELEW